MLTKRTAILAIILVCLAVYANSAFNDFVWDDEFLIQDNQSIMSWKYGWIQFALDIYHSFSNYYRPVQMLTYMADFSVWRLNPFGYHLTNIFLHAAVSVLAFLFFFMITKDKRAAFIGALLYAVHPANTGAVAYIAGRADMLAAIFTLLSFMALHAHFKARGGREMRLYYAASLAAFLTALLSKEIAVITPLFIICYRFFFIEDAEVEKSRAALKSSYISWFIVITGVYIILRSHALNFQDAGILESKYGLYQRFLTSLKAVMAYFGIIFFPVDLRMERSIPYAASFWENGVLLSSLGIFLTTWFALKVKKISKEAFFGIAFFFIALLPVSNIFPMGSNLAEHWLYMPMMGISLAASVLGARLWDAKRWTRPFLAFLFAAYFMFFSYQTVDRNFDWRDNFTIYRHTMKYNSASIKILNNLGNYYCGKGEFKKALWFHKRAAAVNPLEHRARLNIGIDYENMGYIDEAMKHYKMTMKLKPDYVPPYLRAGNIYLNKGDADTALELYKAAAKYDELSLAAQNRLGNVYFDNGRYSEAKEAYEKAAAIDPYAAGAHNNLANALSRLGLKEDAIKEYKKAVELCPENAEYYFNLGTEYGKQGGCDEAIEPLKEAHRLRPKHVDTLINLGAAYFSKKEFTAAEKEWNKVLRLDPKNEIAKEHLNRIILLRKTNRSH